MIVHGLDGGRIACAVVGAPTPVLSVGPFTKYYSYAGDLTGGFEYFSGGYAVSMEGMTSLNLGGRLASADVLPYRLLLVLVFTIPMPRALALQSWASIPRAPRAPTRRSPPTRAACARPRPKPWSQTLSHRRRTPTAQTLVSAPLAP